MGAHVLPDSRAKNETFGSQMVDWELPGGGTVRLEAVLVYCANCGKEYGYVPRENTTFAFWLCNKCYGTYGGVVGTYAMPDDEWSAAVRYELQAKCGGRDATPEEIVALIESGCLGAALEALAREAPYASKNKRGNV